MSVPVGKAVFNSLKSKKVLVVRIGYNSERNKTIIRGVTKF